MNQFAPPTESYLPTPEFHHNPRQREVDFAQLIASGGDPVQSLIKSAIVPAPEATKLTRSELYKLATNLLRSPAVQERIDHFLILHRASMDTSAQRIKQELAAIAFVDPSLAMEDRAIPTPTEDDPDATTTVPTMARDIRTLPRYVRAAIKEFYVDRDGFPRYKFHDKLKSIQMIADLEGLFNEAHAAKAPTISFNLGGSTTEIGANGAPVIDITPTVPGLSSTVPDFLR